MTPAVLSELVSSPSIPLCLTWSDPIPHRGKGSGTWPWSGLLLRNSISNSVMADCLDYVINSEHRDGVGSNCNCDVSHMLMHLPWLEALVQGALITPMCACTKWG